MFLLVPADICVYNEKFRINWKCENQSEWFNSTKDCSAGSYFLGRYWLWWFVYFTSGIALYHISV